MDNAEILKEYGKYVDTERPTTGGSVAYDLSRFDNRASVREAVQASPPERTAPRREAPKRAKLSFSVLLLYGIIAGLAAILISNYVQLTVLTDELSVLTDQYEDLQNELVILQKQYDQRYILNDIETYAVNTLGMEKLESSMMEYIELPNPDTITVIDPYEDDKVAGFFRDLKEKLTSILEFLA